MAAQGISGVCGIDTRALTRRLRDGVTLGRIIQGNVTSSPMAPIADPNARNLVAEVSIKVCAFER